VIISRYFWTNPQVFGTLAWMNSGNDRHSNQERDLEKEVDSLRRDNKCLQRRLDKVLAENERLRKEREEALPSPGGRPHLLPEVVLTGSEATRPQGWNRLLQASLPVPSPASGPAHRGSIAQ
jgi:hypothetical protein